MRDAAELDGINKMTYLASIPKGEIAIGMCVHKDNIYIATDKAVYKLSDDKKLDRIIEAGDILTGAE